MPPTTATESPSIPQIGMLATVRNRRGLVTSVDAFDGGAEGRVHLISIEYLDPDGSLEDQLIWEREPEARLLQPSALPEVSRQAPMDPTHFDALVRATRWSAMSPYIDPDGSGPLDRLPLSSPVHGAIQVEDFQLVPLWKAMRMPRVALLLADDVGLGKTIEAGLILTELLLRRRVRRVLIVCPASLRTQWKQEMHDKFSLHFDIVDRSATHDLQKRLGLDANPWRTFHRVITSYDYLKQADIFEQFRSATTPTETAGSPHLPWDLLIVDEAHNLSPSSFGDDSDVARLLQWLSPMFEHRLFLTATPHNGHTRSFTGLLESLDPVRFTRKSDALTNDEKERIKQVVIRRLKSEINALTDPPRFADRFLEAVPITLSPAEAELAVAFDAFKKKVKSIVRSLKSRSEEIAGTFAVEVLGKRLLSCPSAFANSWHRYKRGIAAEEEAAVQEVRSAERAVREETADDREAESRTGHAAETVGAWLKPLANQLQDEMAALDAALEGLGLGTTPDSDEPLLPNTDVRFDALLKLIDKKLLERGKFRDDERLVIFTEYKTTLDYLELRLRKKFPEDGVIRTLFGERSGTGGRSRRDDTIAAFNDPEDPVRILISTDAASEGLNLQESARYLHHYDVPWNPSRLEQRNGRLDRHGQAIKEMGGKGSILHVCSRLVDPNTVLRIAAIDKAIAEAGPDVKLFMHLPDTDSQETGDQKINGLLAAKAAEIDGIISTGYVSSVVAARSLRNIGDKRIKMIGIDDDPIVLQAIKDGYLQGTMAQNPYGQGYIASFVLKRLHEGCKIKANAPFQETAQNKTFIDSGTLLINADNIDTYKDELKKIAKDIIGSFEAKYLTCE